MNTRDKKSIARCVSNQVNACMPNAPYSQKLAMGNRILASKGMLKNNPMFPDMMPKITKLSPIQKKEIIRTLNDIRKAYIGILVAKKEASEYLQQSKESPREAWEFLDAHKSRLQTIEYYNNLINESKVMLAEKYGISKIPKNYEDIDDLMDQYR